jgi:DNA-binding CsgD family transcriptional regulator
MVSTRDGIVERAIALRRELGDPGSLGRTILLASRIAWEHDRTTVALQLAEEAVEVLAPVGGDELAMAYATISQLAIGTDEQRAIRYAEEAMALAGPEPSRVRLNALTNEGAARMTNHYPDGTNLLEEAFEMAGELGLSLDQLRAAINLAWCHRIHFEPDRSDSWLRAGIEVGRKAEIPTLELHLKAERAAMTAMKGEWGSAVALVDEVLAASSVLGVTVKLASSTLSSIQVRRGDPNALEAAREAWELVKIDQVRVAGPLGSVLAEYTWLGGSLEPGLMEELDQLLARSLDIGARPFAGKLAIWLWLAGRLAKIPHGLSEPYVWLGQGDWERAADFFAARGIPYERAVALSLGGIDAKLEALAIADSLGAVPLSSRIRRELESAGVQGVPPRRHRKEGTSSAGGLTARQVEVLGLLAQGSTNIEIADRLFLSKRTVDHHVSAILTVLGAHNRSEAAHKAPSRPSHCLSVATSGGHKH